MVNFRTNSIDFLQANVRGIVFYKHQLLLHVYPPANYVFVCVCGEGGGRGYTVFMLFVRPSMTFLVLAHLSRRLTR